MHTHVHTHGHTICQPFSGQRGRKGCTKGDFLVHLFRVNCYLLSMSARVALKKMVLHFKNYFKLPINYIKNKIHDQKGIQVLNMLKEEYDTIKYLL